MVGNGVARLVMVLGAVASVALTLYNGRHNASHLLIAIFVVWVLAPFAALLFADMNAKVLPVRRALDRATLLVAVVSPLIYAYAVFAARRPTPFFVMLPPLSLLGAAIVFAVATISGRNRPF